MTFTQALLGLVFSVELIWFAADTKTASQLWSGVLVRAGSYSAELRRVL